MNANAYDAYDYSDNWFGKENGMQNGSSDDGSGNWKDKRRGHEHTECTLFCLLSGRPQKMPSSSIKCKMTAIVPLPLRIWQMHSASQDAGHVTSACYAPWLRFASRDAKRCDSRQRRQTGQAFA